MIDELKRTIQNSTEEEVKSLLFQMLFRIHTLDEVEAYSDEQFVSDMKRSYADFLHYKQKVDESAQYEVVHLAFGDSAAGCLKKALEEMGLQNEEKVINVADRFSIGPVWNLHEANGLRNRHEWLKEHINLDDETIDQYPHTFHQTVSEIRDIPQDTPIIIWTGENVQEQTALRFVLHALQEKPNDIFIENITEDYNKLFAVPEDEPYPIHTGQVSPDKLRIIYEKNKEISALTKDERHLLENEWEALSAGEEVLRIWKQEELHHVGEDYYDDLIMDTLRNIHHEKKNHEFIKSARLIGEVMGQVHQVFGDQFFEYRVRHLIVNGHLEIKGVPNAMRNYSVRIKT
ncbi:DUF1835 domain-containing protein [Halobacillus litoralis]|uniref:DUF1835 domain-containing protein n=1 Tax=Halobacillus litoralis TaxID=45668 RepID=UPI001CD4EA93|nr:DUF1835 domain-containing protein [Halobacillus litoralis]MCA0970805.1 DUF1835 domain-containing protein [Halobacillus litoralis]